MIRRIYIALLFSSLCNAAVYGQTDVGSASSGGAVTADQSLAALTPDKKLQLQEQELDAQLAKLEASRQKTSVGRVSLMDTERESIKNAYRDFRSQGHEISPFDFLAIAVAVQTLPPGGILNKNATLIRAELEAKGVKNENLGLLPEVAGVGAQSGAGPISKQYKESLEAARTELRNALK